jgi:hypothetical protein
VNLGSCHARAKIVHAQVAVETRGGKIWQRWVAGQAAYRPSKTLQSRCVSKQASPTCTFLLKKRKEKKKRRTQYLEAAQPQPGSKVNRNNSPNNVGCQHI